MHNKLEVDLLLLASAHSSAEEFARLLCKCRYGRNRVYALRLYECICIKGLECDNVLGNYLVPLFVKVGCMLDALYLFDRISLRNELSWNFMLSGYNNSGQPEKALDLYKMMRNVDVCSSHPNQHTFVALLKACIRLRDMRTSLHVHVECDSRGFLHSDISLATTLADTYAKCGSIERARQVFDKLHVRDTISWTSLIVGYAENGKSEEAIECFEKMLSDGIFPDIVTFISILKACCNSGSINEGQMMHCEVERRGFLQGNLELGSSLVNLYAKCGYLNKAREIFDKFMVQDVVLWTALIGGYAEHGHYEEALKCIEQMQSECVLPDSVVFVLSLNACNSVGAIERGREVHAILESKGSLDVEINITTALVDMYAKSGMLRKAQEIFDRLKVQDVATWTTLIMGYTENGCGEEALKCFEQMQFEGVAPDVITIVCGLKACGDVVSIEKGKELHSFIEKSGPLEEESIVRSTLIEMYVKFDLLSKAQENFDKLMVRDVISWNALITGYAENGNSERVLECFNGMKLQCVLPDSLTYISVLKACASIGAIAKGKQIHEEINEQESLRTDFVVEASLIDMYGKCGLLREAREAFDKLPVKDIVCWTALLSLYVESSHGEEALNCLELMQFKGIHPNEGTFVHILKACGSVGAIRKGQEIHADIHCKGLLENSHFLGTSLVDMYAKCGFPSLAWNVFEKIQYRDLITWTTLISGYGHIGETKNVFHLFDKMVEEGVKPSPVTFIIVLNACRRAGLFHKGQMYFEAMSKDFGISPIPKHRITMIDHMCCVGQLTEVIIMMMGMKKLPFCLDSVVWHTILSSCRNVGNVELGEQAFEQAIRVDKNDAAAYVLMSHIYAGT